MAVAIEARGLTRVYRGSRKRPDIRAVDRVDLHVDCGEVVALLGPNGAGKTTMVRLLTCLLRPTEGTAAVYGHDLRQEPRAVRAICGLSTEGPGLYERLTAGQYLGFFGRMYGVPEGELAGRVEAQLRAAGLWERRGERLATFSKGMRQKMNIARALLHRPKMVFLDEPTAGLDVEAARAVRSHILDMSHDAETTFLICTHNLPEAERLCSRIAVMNQGSIIAQGTPEELKARLFGGRAFRARLRGSAAPHLEAVRSAPGVGSAEADGNELVVRLEGSEEEVNPRLVRCLVERGADLVSLASEGRSLEDVYLHLVHREAEGEEAQG